MALSSVCSAFSSLIVYFAHDKEGIESITYWMMGSLAGASWSRIAITFPIAFVGTMFFCTQSRTLNLMLLGDESAITLGKDLHRWRQLYLLVSSIIVGFAVYSAGMIGFVGLIIPHVMRMIYGTDHRRLLPASALAGAILLVWADIGCRVLIQGMELPIGLLTSIIGAPCFIYLMVRKSYGFGGAER
jgi:iron complex transport system permease protein